MTLDGASLQLFNFTVSFNLFSQVNVSLKRYDLSAPNLLGLDLFLTLFCKINFSTRRLYRWPCITGSGFHFDGAIKKRQNISLA